MYLHARVPAFYAAVHQAVSAPLRGRPVAVAVDGGDQAPLFATSVEARAAEIWPGLRAAAARRRCRDLIVVTPEPDWYRRAQSALATVCNRASPRVGGQRGCLDVDLAGTERLWQDRLHLADPLGQAEQLAHEVQRTVVSELRCDLRVGVAERLRVARLAARAAKRGVLRIETHACDAFLDRLPLTWCDELSHASRTLLTSCGLTTIAQARTVGAAHLLDLLGAEATDFLALLAHAEDPPVPALGDPEPALDARCRCGSDGADLASALHHVAVLARDLGFTLRERHLATTVLTLDGRHRDGRTVTRTQRCTQQLQHDDDIAAVARDLVTRLSRRPYWESLHLQATGLCSAEDQQRLFAPVRDHRIEAARDHLRRRFGHDCVAPAADA